MGFVERIKPSLAVDTQLLPMKLHYLLYSLALSSTMTYFSLIAKDIGLGATALGVNYTVVPFSTVIFAPIFGVITDKFKKIRNIIIILLIFHTPLYFGINYIPTIQREKQFFYANVSCEQDSYTLKSESFLTLTPHNKSFYCEMKCRESLMVKLNGTDINIGAGNVFEFQTESFSVKSQYLIINKTSINGTSPTFNCVQDLNSICQTNCSIETPPVNDFYTYQFWMFLFLLIFALITTNIIIALSDAACHEKLKGRVNQFGKQRVWLSFGWGFISLFTGPLVEYMNADNPGRVDYSICFYIMLPLMIADIIVLTQTELIKEKSSSNILKDVSKIFTSAHPFFFLFAVFLDGALSAILWNFAFWYLDDMGASKTVIGLSVAILCLFAEVPFMFVSGWIIKRIGRDNCMCLALFTFSIWFISAKYIYDPWLVLLLYFTQGPSYGLFYAAISSYAKVTAPPGTEATFQTIMGATFHGLGIGSGGLLGGLGFDHLGGRETFFVSGLVSLGGAVVYKLLTKFIADEYSVQKKVEAINGVVSDAKSKTAEQNV